MASSMTALVAGTVLKTERRQGVSKATGNPYDIRSARVLVANTGVADVTLSDNVPVPQQGEEVAWVCEFSVYAGDVQGKALEAA